MENPEENKKIHDISKIVHPEENPQEDGLDVIDLDEDAAAAPAPKKRSWLNIVLLVIGILMVAYAAYSFISLYLNYHTSNQEYSDIANEYVDVNDNFVLTPDSEGNTESIYISADTDTSNWYDALSVDLASLQKSYPDVAAWLYQEGGTAINYPVMYNEDTEYYLHKTYKGTYAYAGSLFMEGMNNRDFNDSHTIIYGHNMRNGSMFGTLKWLRNDGYIDEHGYFDLFLPDEIRRYKVFGYEVTTNTSWVYQVPFGVTADFTGFLNTIHEKSEIDTGYTVTNEDKVITLSTCYGVNTNKRFVVHLVWMDTYYYATGTTESPRAARDIPD